MLIPRMAFVHRIAQRIVPDENLFALPVFVIRMAEQDADAEIDLDEIRRDQFSIHDDARGHEHFPPPVGHVAIFEIAVLGILQTAPAPQQDAAISYLFVSWQRSEEHT